MDPSLHNARPRQSSPSSIRPNNKSCAGEGLNASYSFTGTSGQGGPRTAQIGGPAQRTKLPRHCLGHQTTGTVAAQLHGDLSSPYQENDKREMVTPGANEVHLLHDKRGPTAAPTLLIEAVDKACIHHKLSHAARSFESVKRHAIRMRQKRHMRIILEVLSRRRPDVNGKRTGTRSPDAKRHAGIQYGRWPLCSRGEAASD
ncbi:hypothetical protein EVAR_80022_1 [Eumeta japonica]|uniref:Uncharacterized protein n=1 Tax=Eumeta variegata TaxID=151549 RepID=A0A4C1WP95_EUMVA|nr:hypothetical protein EVAR_80022_1 [Eumeta japonica]